MNTTVCIACNSSGCGMVHIYSHPNQLDVMFSGITGIEIEEDGCLCIPCYDDMKIAYSFRQKCLQTQVIRNEKTLKIIKVTPSYEELIEGNENVVTTTNSGLDTEIEIINKTDEYKVEQDDLIDIDEYIYVVDEESDHDNEEKKLHSEGNECNNEESVEEILVEDDILIKENKNLQNIFQCKICLKNFSTSLYLQKHTNLHNTTEINDNSVQEEIIESKTQYKDILEKPLPKQCCYCFKEFSTMKLKNSHQNTHKNETRPFKCPAENCQSSFVGKTALRSHIRIHSSYKRYKCRFCNHRNHQRGNILAHERLHTGEKPFLCPHCGKSFNEAGNLKSHIRFHTNERPYACSFCPKTFKTQYSQKIHIRHHTKEKPYLCGDCGKSFSASGKLLVHKRSHSGYKPYKCKTCPSAFVDSSGLKRHSKIHVTNNEPETNGLK